MTERAPTTKKIAEWFGIVGLAILILIVSVWIHAQYSFQVLRREKSYEAESVLQKFHDGFNTGQLDRICEAAIGCSVPSIGREGWDSYIKRVRDRAGLFRTVRTSNIRVYIEPPGVHVTYVSSFEKTECTEIFDLKDFDLKDGVVIGGPLKIVGYRVLIDGKQIPPP